MHVCHSSEFRPPIAHSRVSCVSYFRTSCDLVVPRDVGRAVELRCRRCGADGGATCAAMLVSFSWFLAAPRSCDAADDEDDDDVTPRSTSGSDDVQCLSAAVWRLAASTAAGVFGPISGSFSWSALSEASSCRR